MYITCCADHSLGNCFQQQAGFLSNSPGDLGEICKDGGKANQQDHHNGTYFDQPKACIVSSYSGSCLGYRHWPDHGMEQTDERRVKSYFDGTASDSPIAWIPLVILWFGVGEFSKILLVFIGAFFPVVLNTATGWVW